MLAFIYSRKRAVLSVSEHRAENYFNAPCLPPHISSIREEQKISTGYRNAGTGEEAGPGSEDGTGRGEEMVKGAAPGAEAVETEDKLAPPFFSCSFYYPVPPIPLPSRFTFSQKTFTPTP